MRILWACLSLGAWAGAASAHQQPGSWSDPAGAPAAVHAGGAIVAAGPDTLYVMCGTAVGSGATETPFFRHTPSTGSWDTMAPVPFGVAAGASMAWMPGTSFIYLLGGIGQAEFRRYDMDFNEWSPAAYLAPFRYSTVNLIVGSSVAMCAASNGRLYAFTGTSTNAGGNVQNQRGFVSFSNELDPQGSWQNMAVTPAVVGAGSSLVALGATVYGIRGASSEFWRYTPDGTAGIWVSQANLPEFSAAGGCLAVGPSQDVDPATGSRLPTLYCRTGFNQTANPPGTPSPFVNRSLYRFNFNPIQGDGGAWARLPDCPAVSKGGGGMAWPGGADETLYCLRGWSGAVGTIDFWRYSSDNRSYGSIGPVPVTVGAGACMVGVGNGSDLYVLSGESTRTFLRWSTSTGAWSAEAIAPAAVWTGASMTYDPVANAIYAIPGADPAGYTRPAFWHFQPGPGWTVDDSLPAAAGTGWGSGSKIVAGGNGSIYGLVGWNNPADANESKRFYRFTPGSGWTRMKDAPGNVDAGSAMVWPGAGDLLYVLQGNLQQQCWVYCMSLDRWNCRPDGQAFDPADLPVSPAAPPGFVGASLCFPGSGTRLFAFAGADGDRGNRFWSYSIPDDVWYEEAGAPGSVFDGAALAGAGPGEYIHAIPGNAGAQIWKYRIGRERPRTPTAAAQYRFDGVTAIPHGGTTAQAGFIVRADLASPYPGQALRLQVEIEESASVYDGVPDASSAPVASGSTATLALYTLVPGVSYKWRTRCIDATGLASAWGRFGTTDPDIVARANDAPVASAWDQVDPASGLPMAAGRRLDDPSVAFRVSAQDPDDDRVFLEIEWVLVGQDFSGHATAYSAVGAAGPIEITAGVERGRSYRWRWRLGDEWGVRTTWNDFGGNGDAADFTILALGSGNPGGFGCFGTAPGSGSPDLLLGVLAAALVCTLRPRT